MLLCWKGIKRVVISIMLLLISILNFLYLLNFIYHFFLTEFSKAAFWRFMSFVSFILQASKYCNHLPFFFNHSSYFWLQPFFLIFHFWNNFFYCTFRTFGTGPECCIKVVDWYCEIFRSEGGKVFELFHLILLRKRMHTNSYASAYQAKVNCCS